MNQALESIRPVGQAPAPQTYRWVCQCRPGGVLLATFDTSGLITIKVRNGWYRTRGVVDATCPRCGKEHRLDPVAGIAQIAA